MSMDSSPVSFCRDVMRERWPIRKPRAIQIRCEQGCQDPGLTELT